MRATLNAKDMEVQTKLGSFIEVTLGKAVGFVIALAITPFVFSFIGIDIDLDQAFGVTIFFTLFSLVREYIWRRFFNWIMSKGHFIVEAKKLRYIPFILDCPECKTTSLKLVHKASRKHGAEWTFSYECARCGFEDATHILTPELETDKYHQRWFNCIVRKPDDMPQDTVIIHEIRREEVCHT